MLPKVIVDAADKKKKSELQVNPIRSIACIDLGNKVDNALFQATPKIWNSYQGSHFTSPYYLAAAGFAMGFGSLIWDIRSGQPTFVTAIVSSLAMFTVGYTSNISLCI